MKKHNVFLLFTSLTALLFCACSSELKEKENASSKPGTVTLSIANDTQRTISPASGISYKNVSEWTVTFKDITESRSEKYNDIVKTVSFSESANQQIQLPLGTYNVTLNGTANNATSEETATTQTVPFYGESTVTVEDGKSASISVFVAPKKSNGGTGSFNFTVNISRLEQFPDPVFESKLIPYSQGEEKSLSSSFSESILNVNAENIPSGFYKLSIKCKISSDTLKESKEIFYPYHDFLVEIVDGLETKGSADITVSLEDSKTYYATKGETIGNGAFESMPKNLDELLVDINRTTISTANIYIVDEVLTDETSTSYPEIDVSKVNATGKTYCIYTKSEKTQEYNSTPCYTITGAAIEGGEPTIDIERSVTTVTLKNSQSSSGISGSAKIVALGSPEFVLKDNTSVFIDLTDQNNQIACTTICMPPDSTTFDSYYVENPCVTVKNLSTTQTSFSVFVEQSLSNSYSVVTNSSDDGTYKTTNFYIIPSYTAELPVEGIPNYRLVATKGGNPTESTQFFVGDTVTITATSKSEGGSFADGTTFAWFINGEKIDCTAQSYEITFGVNAEASNTIICLVGYNGQYATAGINLSAQEKPIVLYNNTSDKTKPALSYATLTSSGLSTPKELLANTNDADTGNSTEIVDYCFDTSNNLYAIVKQTGANILYSIKKYEYNGSGYSNTPIIYDCTMGSINYISHIEAADNSTLYAGVGTDSGAKIAKITFTAPNKTSANRTATFTPYNLSIEYLESYSIYTFCTDTDGTNFYIITNIDGTCELASYTVSGDTLYKDQPITLVSCSDEAGYSSEIFSTIPTDNLQILVYSDICYINDTLYLLVKELNGPSTTALYSRGALCTFNVSDAGISAGKIGIGYQTTEGSISYTGDPDESGNYPTVTQPSYLGDGKSTFYGPVKFVARKEDELIIADEGYSVKEEEYAAKEGHTKGTISSKNAIVTFDLNEQTLNFTSLDGEYFENKYSGYFYGSSIQYQ